MRGLIHKEFAGKKRGFVFNMLTWEYVCESLDMAMTDVLANLEGPKQFKVMRVLLYSALLAYSDLHSETLDITDKQVGAYMGDDPTVLNELIQCMSQSMATDKPLAGTPDKKKSTSVK